MARPLQQLPLIRELVSSFRERLTARGRYLLMAMIVLAVLGLDTRATQVFLLFGVAAGLFLAAALFAFLPRPRVGVECRLPARAAAQTPLWVEARVSRTSGGRLSDLQLSFPRPRKWGSSIRFQPAETFLECGADAPDSARVRFLATRRGRYILRGAALRRTDPLRLAATAAVALPDQPLLVYPRFYSMDEFIVPLGRRYQPGGIPLSSSLGDSIEFVGTREYRAGDPIKHIHWRSWARRGKPVVKEFQEEYFCRIALILDTFLPPKAGARQQRAFEAAISVLASIADYFSRSEYIVDILAAGPDIYEVSAGRSLAYLENILDVLACLEPCYQPPFQAIGPALFDKLAQITTVVAVLQDWDQPRQAFLRRVKVEGAAVRAIIVREERSSQPWERAADELGEISQVSPAEIERRIKESRTERRHA